MEAKKTKLEIYRQNAIDAAYDLKYSREVIAKLSQAETEGQIERIMVNARKECMKR